MRNDAIKAHFFTNSSGNTHTYTRPMHGRVMIEVKVGKGKHKRFQGLSQGAGRFSIADCRFDPPAKP
jgi:hypothetical protein